MIGFLSFGIIETNTQADLKQALDCRTVREPFRHYHQNELLGILLRANRFVISLSNISKYSSGREEFEYI